MKRAGPQPRHRPRVHTAHALPAADGGVACACRFVLLVNKQGQTRLAKYTDASMGVEERRALEGEIVRKCLARSEKQACFGRGAAQPWPSALHLCVLWARRMPLSPFLRIEPNKGYAIVCSRLHTKGSGCDS